MKPKALVAIAAAVVAVTGLVVIASAAQADIVAPTTPYPDVAINTDVCTVEQIAVRSAQRVYDLKLKRYNTAVTGGTTFPADETRQRRLEMDTAAVGLNDAKYALAKCQNDKANPADKACIDLALDLNRLIDNAAVQADVVAQLEAQVKAKTGSTATEREAIEVLKTDLGLARDKLEALEAQIKAQRAEIARKNCKDTERPAPKPSDKQTTLPASDGPVDVTSAPVATEPVPARPTATVTSAVGD